MNKVILIGRLTKDADLRATTSGTSVASFTLAVDRPFKAQDGTKETDFINCIAWRNQAENVSKYVHKGSLIAVEGRLQVRTYDDESGKRNWITEVVADSITFLERKKQETKEETTEEEKLDPFLEFSEEMEAEEGIKEKLPF